MTSVLFRRSPAAAVVFVLVLVGVEAQGPGSTIPTPEIFEAIEVAPGRTICEIGAGDGELSVEAARLVGATGRVFTSELGEERLRELRDGVERSGLANITVVAAHPDRTNLPESGCDAVFMRNVYHHFGNPAAMNASIAASLRPGGRVAVVDFRPDGGEASRPEDRDEDGSHGIRAETVSREMQAAGLEPVRTRTSDGRWYMVVFVKPL
ncbi:MAG TPA: methyltransferase domain-containing protein [Vicinamibacterales bacterium]|nr:methyltransferase domain-containing protein [Vicinamibacterales bacterium]